ncbi:hypothetical protein WJN01_11900 [Flavobacteriaceae bacterium SZ-1-7]|uniref:hypothetical protein n=1 Tax=Tamlana sedimenti TaxID=3134126 RepID=UPI00312278D5
MATIIFWVVILSKNFHENIDIALYILVSMVPISICCTATILFTIAPFFWLENNNKTKRDVFKKWFPFYAILSFGLCFYGSISTPEIICFFSAAYFTSLQSWVWFASEKKLKHSI